MKKIMICWMLAALLLCGCGLKRGAQDKAPSGAPETVVLSAAPVSEGTEEDARYGVYSLDGGEQTEEAGAYDSDTADENALLAQDGAVFTVANADVNKTGDSTRPLYSGLNAAAASVTGAHLLMKSCTLTTNGRLASGLYCAGEGSRLTVEDSQAVTAGDGSPALVVADGATATITKTRLMSEAGNAPLLASRGDAAVTLSGCTVKAGAQNAVEALGGMLRLTLDAQQLSGDIQLLADAETPAALSLTLQNGASFTGTIHADNADAVDVSLDAASSWTLTGETTVSALTAPDTSFSGIQSGGFNIYYNAELEANAWLQSQAYLLPGGGCLTPLI